MTVRPVTRVATAGSPRAVILFTVFIDMLGFGIVLPILPYFGERFGATPTWIGVLVASFSFMQFVFNPIWGRLSDRAGRRPVLLLSLTGSALSYLLFAVAGSFALLLVSRVLAGIAGANISAAQAAMADITPPERRARGMGQIGAAFGVGFTFGPLIAGFATRWWGLHAPGWIAAALAAANLVLAWLVLPETLRPGERAGERRGLSLVALRHVFAHPVLASASVVFTATTFASSALTSMLALFLARRFGYDASAASWVYMLIGVVVAVVQGGAVHALVRGWGERAVALAGLTLLAVDLLVFSLPHALPGLLGVVVLYSAAVAAVSPTTMSLVSLVADSATQGEVIGVVQGLASLARVLGPVWGGVAFGHLGVAAPFVSSGIVCAVVGAYAWRALLRGQASSM